MRRKKERSKQGQTNKAKLHSTPKAVTFPRKNELPQVGLEPTTLYTPHVHVHVITYLDDYDSELRVIYFRYYKLIVSLGLNIF